jgi:polysaccharide pyruvyl transferase WcaK-like protein
MTPSSLDPSVNVCQRPSESAVTIGVFGHYGNQNLGDEAIIEASIHNIRQRLPQARIICFSLRPRDTQARHGLSAYPIRDTAERVMSRSAEMERAKAPGAPQAQPGDSRTLAGRLKARLKTLPLAYRLARFIAGLPQALWRPASEIGFLWRSRTILKEVDLLLIAGSNQFLDNFGGIWGFPYTLLKWTLLAKSTGTKVAFVSVGAGPLSATVSKAMNRIALALADYQSVRDEQSKALLTGSMQAKLPLVYPDLAFSLPVSAGESVATRLRASGSKPTVGINVMAIYNERYWFAPDRDKYRRYVGQVATFATFLVRRGYPAFFFGNQPYDELVIDDVTEAMANMGLNRDQIPARAASADTVTDLMQTLRRADVVVAARFHAIVLALHAHRAVLGVCYGAKCVDLLRAMDQGEFAFDLDDFRTEDLERAFLRLCGSLDAQIERIRRRHAQYQRALDEQYGKVLGLLSLRATRSVGVTS